MSNSTARRPFIAGNWKMHKTPSEARTLAADIAGALELSPEAGLRVGLFPNYVALAAVVETCASSAVLVGAQDLHWEEAGAYTGAISAAMITGAGATAVLIGHSERRHVFGESDEETGRKVARAIAAGLEPVLCVGEKLAERSAGETMAVVSRQLRAGLEPVATADALARVTIAYEPVWAIGTGETATPDQGQEVHRAIRAELADRFAAAGGSGGAERTPILYGGSVKPENAGALLAEDDIDGLLVGGASLTAESFVKICEAAR